MTKLGFVLSALVLVSGAVASCSGSDSTKHVRADAGAAGLDSGGEGGVEQGGSRNRAGEGGALVDNPGGSAGAPPSTLGGAGMSTEGGVGGETPVAGGAGGAGGAASVDCPAETGNFTYQCGEVATLWQPIWSSTNSRFELDVSQLPFPVASGTVSYYASYADGQKCGTAQISVSGDTVVAPVDTAFIPTIERITTFSLVDVCGNHHDYDAVGAPACFELKGTGSFGDVALTCDTTFPSMCPQGCE